MNAELEHNSVKGYLLELSVEFIMQSLEIAVLSGRSRCFCGDMVWWCGVVVLFLSKSEVANCLKKTNKHTTAFMWVQVHPGPKNQSKLRFQV